MSGFQFSAADSFRPVQGILTSRVEAELCRSQRTPCDTIAGVVQATERTLQRHDYKLNSSKELTLKAFVLALYSRLGRWLWEAGSPQEPQLHP